MPKSALVLSGGGALGVAHIGVLKNLGKNYQFDFIVGVSAGAIIGGGIACEKTPEEIWNIIKETSLFHIAFDISLKNSGLIRGDKIHQILDEVYEGKHFEDLSTPFYVGATDFSTGNQIIINSGKIADAVRASMAVPVIFEPFFHPQYQKFLVDGGLSQNFPLDLAIKKYKGNEIIGINVANLPPLPKDFGTKKILGRNTDLLRSTQRAFKIFFKNQQQNFPKDPRVQIIEPDLSAFSSITFSQRKLEQILKQGEKYSL